jgi:anti-sigma B factor antagonist
MGHMMLEAKNIKDILVVSLKKTTRLNALIVEAVKDQLLEFYNKPNARVVFDLKGIKYIDSSGFGVFLSAVKAANNNYGQFKICNVNPEVMELFRLLQLHHLFEIYDELGPCLESFDR